MRCCTCMLTPHNRKTDDPLPTFHPEFGRFMLESTPGAPFSLSWKDLLSVEPNMKLRYVHLGGL